MLDPEYIETAGDMVGAVYGEIEDELLEYLCRLLLSNADAVGQRGLTAINLLAQTQAPYLAQVIKSHEGEVSRAVAKTVLAAIERSDARDAAVTKTGQVLAGSRPRQVEQTVTGIAAILERDNVEMVRGALDLWNNAVTEAVTKVNTGTVTAEKAIHGAVRRMMREGVSTIQYRNAATGAQTVKNRIDVAVRRHVRTQIAQDGARRTMQVCEDAGVSLVEVSSHGGARPSHAKWQGRVYSLKGDVTIGGVRYKDFYRETGYGSVDGLLGANCRHSFGPWVPGAPRMYSPNPEHPSGLTSDEVYALTQGQRYRERQIRQTKRELKAAQLIADDDASLANVAEVEKLKDKLKRQQAGLRDYIEQANKKGKADVLQRSPNREWAGDMPKVRKTDAARRTVKEFMAQDSVTKALKKRGVSKTSAQKALSAELKKRGVSAHDFSLLSKTNQREVFKTALRTVESYVPGRSEKRIQDALGVRRFVSLDGMPASLKRQTQKTSEKIAAMFPKVDGYIPSIKTTLSENMPSGFEDADAITWPNGKIELNLASYADHAALKARVAQEVEDGWGPQGCDESYILAHEFGHVLDGFLFKKLGYTHKSDTVSAVIQKDIMQRCGLTASPDDIAASVSKYANHSPGEWFAEAIGEAICSDSPRPVAQELLKWVNEQMEGI